MTASQPPSPLPLSPRSSSSPLMAALHADGPAGDRSDRMGLYGWLVGRWEMDALYHLDDGTTRRSQGEIHAGWVLEGRAIQDVWIVPAREGAREDPPVWGDFYGTTLRIFDPEIDAWHILWADPVKQIYRRQIGRPLGNEVLQEGMDDEGTAVRWRFTEITPDSFHWLAERTADGGEGGSESWRVLVEFFARRAAG